MTHKLTFLIVLLAVAGFIFAGCGLDADKQGNVTGPDGGGPPIMMGMKFSGQEYFADLASAMGYPLDDYPLDDIPADAPVYGLGPVFPGWNGSFGSKYYLGLWGENVEVEFWVETGRRYPLALWVDGRTIVEGITICDSLLTHVYLEGGSPWAHLWTEFLIGLDDGQDPFVQTYDDNRWQMASAPMFYDGWSDYLPDSLQYLNGPPANENYPAYWESNMSWGQSTPLYWDNVYNYWNKWFRVLALENNDDYYGVITVQGQDPYRRTWGVNIDGAELWHFWHPPGTPDDWLVFRFGFNTDGTINQLEDNRLSWTGGP